MSKKKYDGYRSYAYLNEGEDYQAIRDSGPSYTQVRCVDGMENPGEAMRNAVRWLVNMGTPTPTSPSSPAGTRCAY